MSKPCEVHIRWIKVTTAPSVSNYYVCSHCATKAWGKQPPQAEVNQGERVVQHYSRRARQSYAERL